MKNITLEQLAEKLNGNLWVKGDLKRIYLDRGYNTKKMSTKTYVYQNENGFFRVSCYIECPSQPYAWIKSQQQEIIDNVLEDIEQIKIVSQLILVEVKILENSPEIMVYIKRNEEVEPSWFTEDIFFKEFGMYPEDVFDSLKKSV